jgi:hypothetical protein
VIVNNELKRERKEAVVLEGLMRTPRTSVTTAETQTLDLPNTKQK